MKKIKIDDTYHITFPSVDDFYNNRDVKSGANNDCFQCRYREALDMSSTKLGCEASQVPWRRYGWEEGAKKIQELSEIDFPPRTDKFHKLWSDDEGDDGDMERYLLEMPFLMKRRKMINNKIMKATHLKIRVNIGRDEGRVEEALMKCFCAIRTVDELETNGIRCSLSIEAKNTRVYNLCSAHVKILAKDDDEPVNPSILAHLAAPWFYYYYIIPLYYSAGSAMCGIGPSRSITKEEEHEIIIDKNDCLTKDTAKDFLSNIHEMVSKGE